MGEVQETSGVRYGWGKDVITTIKQSKAIQSNQEKKMAKTRRMASSPDEESISAPSPAEEQSGAAADLAATQQPDVAATQQPDVAESDVSDSDAVEPMTEDIKAVKKVFCKHKALTPMWVEDEAGGEYHVVGFNATMLEEGGMLWTPLMPAYEILHHIEQNIPAEKKKAAAMKKLLREFSPSKYGGGEWAGLEKLAEYDGLEMKPYKDARAFFFVRLALGDQVLFRTGCEYMRNRIIGMQKVLMNSLADIKRAQRELEIIEERKQEHKELVEVQRQIADRLHAEIPIDECKAANIATKVALPRIGDIKVKVPLPYQAPEGEAFSPAFWRILRVLDDRTGRELYMEKEQQVEAAIIARILDERMHPVKGHEDDLGHIYGNPECKCSLCNGFVYTMLHYDSCAVLHWDCNRCLDMWVNLYNHASKCTTSGCNVPACDAFRTGVEHNVRVSIKPSLWHFAKRFPLVQLRKNKRARDSDDMSDATTQPDAPEKKQMIECTQEA